MARRSRVYPSALGGEFNANSHTDGNLGGWESDQEPPLPGRVALPPVLLPPIKVYRKDSYVLQFSSVLIIQEKRIISGTANRSLLSVSSISSSTSSDSSSASAESAESVAGTGRRFIRYSNSWIVNRPDETDTNVTVVTGEKG